MAFGMLPALAQILFPKQIGGLLGLPPQASWFVALTLVSLMWLAIEVVTLRRQVQALRVLQDED